MVAYIILFFVLASIFGLVLVFLFLLKCLGLIPFAKKIATKFFSKSYDKKYEQNGSAPINTDCFICIERIDSQVVATCNHSFCARCILDYVKSKREGQTINCPACRKQICILFRRFQANNVKNIGLKHQICQFNCTRSKQPGFFRSLIQFSNTIQHLHLLFSAQGIKFMLENPRIRMLLLYIIYALSPVDFLPQILLGPVGLIDDAYVSMDILRQVTNLLLQFIREQSNRQRQRA